MRKWLVFVLIAVLLAGCGSSGSNSGSQNSGSSSSASAGNSSGSSSSSSGETKEMVTINYYTWEPTEKDNPIWDEIRRELNIDVQVKSLPDTGGADKETAIDIAQLGGGDVDFRIITESMASTRVAKGLAEPLDDLIAKYNVDMEGLFGNFAQNVVFDGKTYGIPARANAVMYLYNKNLFDAAGVPYPRDGWTWEEFLETAARLTSGEGDSKVYGACTNAFKFTWVYPAITGGASYYNEEGLANIDHPDFVNALRDFHELEQKGYKPSYVSMVSRNSYISPEFLSGKCAIAQGLGYVLRDMRDKERFPFDFEVGTVFPPVMHEGDSAKNTAVGVQFLAINPNSKHKEEAFQAMVYYIQHGAQYIAPFNVPPVANPDEDTINAFIKDTPVSKEDAMRWFDPELNMNNVAIVGPAATEYWSILQEETDMFLAGGQDLETAIGNIKKRADEAIQQQ